MELFQSAAGSASVSRLQALLPLPEDVAAYAGLAHALRGLVVEGHLTVGSRLPSERTLALALGLSRTTITRAYSELVATGWASARQGSGTVVRMPGKTRIPSLTLVPGPRGSAIDLSAAAGLAPAGTRAVVEKAMQWLPGSLDSAGYEPFGAQHLRERIADWFAGRGLPTVADQVVVTPGALAGLSAVLHTVLAPGERVLVESPTYPHALGAIAGARGRVVSVPLVDGWNAAEWTAAARRSRAAAAYLIPDFQNPTGLLMTEAERAALAGALRQAGVVPIIDETPAELDLEAEAPRPLPWAATDDRAFSIGSLSKVLWGGVRVGWVRCPPGATDALRARALQLNLGASALDQLIATSFLEDPQPVLSEVLARLRSTREAWHGQLAEHLPTWRVNQPRGGLALWVELPERRSAELALAADGHGLIVTPGNRFTADRTLANRLRLPLTLPSEVVPEATRRLARAWQDALTGRGGVPRPDALAL